MKGIRQGWCFCMKCGNISSLYQKKFAPPNSAARYLAKPSLPVHFAVSVFGKSVQAADIAAQNGYSNVDIQIEAPIFRGGFLESFKATISYQRGEESEIERNLEVNSEMRICPKCAENVYFLPHAGEYDAYLIGELGRPGVGKTQFAKALASSRFKTQRDSFLGQGASFNYLGGEDEDECGMAAVPTHLDRSGVRTFLVKRRGADPVLIYLIDIAGEFLLHAMSRQQDRAVLKRILTNYCSAFFAFYDPREIASPQLDGYREERKKNESSANRGEAWSDPLPLVHELFSGDMPPIAYILTGLDTLVNVGKSGKEGAIWVNGHKALSAKSALAGEGSLSSITASGLRERMLLSRAAMCSLGLLSQDAGRSANSAWFVLSSGQVELSTGKVNMDCAQGVVEPMAWFLGMAGVAEVKEA